MRKFLISKRNRSVGLNWCFDPILVIFFELKIFSFSKNLQVSDQPTLVKFLTFLKKITSVGSSANFLSVGSI